MDQHDSRTPSPDMVTPPNSARRLSRTHAMLIDTDEANAPADGGTETEMGELKATLASLQGQVAELVGTSKREPRTAATSVPQALLDRVAFLEHSVAVLVRDFYGAHSAPEASTMVTPPTPEASHIWRTISTKKDVVSIAASTSGVFRLCKDGTTDALWANASSSDPRQQWRTIDSRGKAVQLLTTSKHVYQLQKSGELRVYDDHTQKWGNLDKNWDTVQIQGVGKDICQRHKNGVIWLYCGGNDPWRKISSDIPPFGRIAQLTGSSSKNIFIRTSEGLIYAYTGKPGHWTWLDKDAKMIQLAAVESSVESKLYKLRDNGEVLLHTVETESGWSLVGVSEKAVQLVAEEGGTLYTRSRDGVISKYDVGQGWTQVGKEHNMKVLVATREALYVLKMDGVIKELVL